MKKIKSHILHIRNFLSNLSRRNIGVITLAALLSVVGIIYFTTNTKGALAGWFDDSFKYRQRIPITNSGSALTNYQIGITLNTSALVSAGKLQSDCDDIRITSENGEILPHWIEPDASTCSADTNRRIWTKIPSIPASDINIYIYYGNQNATNSEKPDGVFEFFDDFSSSTLSTSKWKGDITGFQISNGNLVGSTTTYRIQSVDSFTGDYKTISRHYVTGEASNGHMVTGFKDVGNTSNAYGLLLHPTNVFYRRDDNTWVGSVAFASVGQWARYEVSAVGTTGVVTLIGETTGANQNGDTNSGLSSEFLTIGTRYDDLAVGQTYNASWDWILVAKAAATEPVIESFASEEITPGPVAYWKLDEGADNTCRNGYDACDSTQNSWNMDISGGTPTWQSRDKCVSGTCMYFDGNGDFLANPNSPDLTTQFTMSAWVKSPNFATQMYVMETEFGAPLMYIQNRYILATLRNSANTAWVTYQSNTNPLIDNEWNHIAVTYDTNDDLKLYHNGSLVFSGTHPNNIGGWTSAANTWIGGRSTVWFNGYIDEPKIYQYARSEAQIKQEYASRGSVQGVSAQLGDDNLGQTLSNGLVGHWKMDESTWLGANAVLDSSGNLNSGTAVGGATVGVGKYGNGGSFDGTDDYVNSGSAPSISDLTNFTVSAWINPEGWGESSFGRIFDKTNKYFYVDNVTGTAALNFVQLGGAATGQWRSVDNSVSLNTWQHVVLVYNSSSSDTDVKMYVNGQSVLVTEVITPSGQATSDATSSLIIGNRTAADRTFDGKIDDFHIYNRALDPSEVKDLYEWAPGPVGYWDFNENTGTTAVDKSGGGYTGTVTGAEWVPGKYGSALKFNGADSVTITSPSLPGIANHITISLWQNGDASIQPQADSVFEGRDVGGTRVLNAHLPWSNGDVYWDAGPGGGSTYDRIQKTAVPANYEGAWNHWAFTKDISSGSMKIYLNGTLWHSGVGNTRPIGIPNTFRIGSYADGTTNYDGIIDDFRVYNYERTPKQIVQDMNGGHPSVGSPVGSALGHWKFDEGYGTIINNNGSIGSTLNGTFGAGTSAPTWTNDGKFGKALSFARANFQNVSVPDNDAFNFPDNNFSFTGWFKTSDTGVRNNIISKWTSGGKYLSVFVYTDDQLWLETKDSNLVYLGAISSGKNYHDGQWHYFAMVRSNDLDKLYLYADGQLLSAVDDTRTGDFDIANPLNFGVWASNNYFEGQLDEMKVYSYALTADEAKVDYNRGKAIVLGSTSTGVGGTAPDNSASREYCIPGDASTCSAPVAEWKMDEGVGGTANDTSGNGYVGNLGTGSSAPKWVPGVHGSALQFDETNDYVQSGDAGDATALTISAWINTDILDNNWRYIIHKRDNTAGVTSNWEFRKSIASWGGVDELEFVYYNTNYRIWYTTNANLEAGKWYYVAVTYDGVSDPIIYKNGIKLTGSWVVGFEGPDGLLTNDHNVQIGTLARVGAYSWMGKLDNIRVYDYVRTPAQIAWEYSKGAPVAHYKMDECEGTTIYNSVQTFDDAPAGNNGTLTIGATGGNTTPGTCATSGAWADGATGKREASIDFDGSDDFINVGGTFLYTDETVSFWAKADWATAAGMPLSSLKYTNPDHDGFRFYMSSDTLVYNIYNNSQAEYTKATRILTGSDWHHFLLTWTSTTTRAYLDGKMINETSRTNTFDSIPTDMDIGRYNYQNNSYFTGQVDDVRIYNYNMTDQQVKTLYNNGAVNFN